MKEIFTRRSVRLFSNRVVEEDKIDKLLRAAMQAPSAVNQQPWSFLVVRDKTKLETLSHLSSGSKMVSNADGVICLLIDSSQDKRPQMWSQDMSAAMQNILLEAVHLDLGACWIGVYPLEDRMNKLSEMLSIPSRYIPFALCAFGYPKDENANKFVDRYQSSKVFYEEVK